MSTWTSDTARAMTAPQEVLVATRRPDGTLRRPRTIWIVRDGERVFIRSTNGRTAFAFVIVVTTRSASMMLVTMLRSSASRPLVVRLSLYPAYLCLMRYSPSSGWPSSSGP